LAIFHSVIFLLAEHDVELIDYLASLVESLDGVLIDSQLHRGSSTDDLCELAGGFTS
jgi:hypothetical protein